MKTLRRLFSKNILVKLLKGFISRGHRGPYFGEMPPLMRFMGHRRPYFDENY